MISVVIPMAGKHNYTDECIDTLRASAEQPLDIIIVDNGSIPEYKNKHARIIHNESNIGFWPSMLSGIELAHSDIVLCMHNDVFVWEKGFDLRLQANFQLDPKLAIAGFFGSKGLGLDGGRAYPESNMVNRKYGTHGNVHGHLLTGEFPSTVFDSLAMCFNRRLLYSIDYNVPPHHWTDRLLCLRALRAGLHLLTVGIEFDHGGGFTSGSAVMNNFTEEWCKAHNLPLDQNWDYTLYEYGRKIFQSEFADFAPNCSSIWVDENYRLSAR